MKYYIHTERGQYRKNIEFQKKKGVIGRGNSADDIVVINDKFTVRKKSPKPGNSLAVKKSLFCFNVSLFYMKS